MKNYVVSTPQENHFFTELYEAEQDFNDAIDNCDEDTTIILYEIPKLPDDCISNQDKRAFLIECLGNGEEEVLQQVN